MTTTANVLIEARIPIPPKKFGRQFLPKYPFAQMKAGDSFAVPVNGEGHKRLAAALGRAASDALGKGNYTIRTNPDKSAVRVWRTA